MALPKFRKGATVEWMFAGRKISGKVQEIFTESATKRVTGKSQPKMFGL